MSGTHSPGDAWRVVVEQWMPHMAGDPVDGALDDGIAYAIANSAEDAARIVAAAYTTSLGPKTRVVRVQYAGTAWQEEASNA